MSARLDRRQRALPIGRRRHNRFEIRHLLSPFDQTAHLCGMAWLEPFVVHRAGGLTGADLVARRRGLSRTHCRIARWPHRAVAAARPGIRAAGGLRAQGRLTWNLSEFLFGAFIYLAAAVISVPIATRLGLGSVLGYLIAGMLIGPCCPRPRRARGRRCHAFRRVRRHRHAVPGRARSPALEAVELAPGHTGPGRRASGRHRGGARRRRLCIGIEWRAAPRHRSHPGHVVDRDRAAEPHRAKAAQDRSGPGLLSPSSCSRTSP